MKLRTAVSTLVFFITLIMAFSVSLVSALGTVPIIISDFSADATLITFDELPPSTAEDIEIVYSDPDTGEQLYTEYIPYWPTYSTVDNQSASLGVIFSQGPWDPFTILVYLR